MFVLAALILLFVSFITFIFDENTLSKYAFVGAIVCSLIGLTLMSPSEEKIKTIGDKHTQEIERCR